ncbi:myb-related transcription factor, partner of profilin-like [Mastomys coucha]|uniref:myb-related transcription factor, partner of profilin-like n=1 Tax=Mastomys coucha TaxID=35658 RepID=UPI0012615DD5|nr:myb-related transcription factor, partner of profilin-like [Mastomys coucha]
MRPPRRAHVSSDAVAAASPPTRTESSARQPSRLRPRAPPSPPPRRPPASLGKVAGSNPLPPAGRPWDCREMLCNIIGAQTNTDRSKDELKRSIGTGLRYRIRHPTDANNL